MSWCYRSLATVPNKISEVATLVFFVKTIEIRYESQTFYVATLGKVMSYSAQLVKNLMRSEIKLPSCQQTQNQNLNVIDWFSKIDEQNIGSYRSEEEIDDVGRTLKDSLLHGTRSSV